MRVLDPTDPLFRAQVPPGVYASVYLPKLQSGTTAPTFDTATLFDVSAWDSWALFGECWPAGSSPLLVLTYYENAASPFGLGIQQQQTIQLPTAGASFLILGRTLGPLLSVQLAAALGGPVASNLEFFVSNRTRIYDQPYTPTALGTILTAVPVQSIPAAGHVILDLPYYLGPAKLGGYFGGAASNLAIATVQDDQAPATILATIDPSSPTAELWIPSNLNAGVGPWRLEVTNATAGALSLAATLTAA
jgi:hypothetical protein